MKIIQDERKLTLAGKGSYYVTIPIAMIKQLGWKKGEKKIIRKQGKKIIIEDWVP
jgi:bifunctional DNA-binding transcriptional regulator/antitoxin component of YhaV-PrlF toxin-antitoxin module